MNRVTIFIVGLVILVFLIQFERFISSPFQCESKHLTQIKLNQNKITNSSEDFREKLDYLYKPTDLKITLSNSKISKLSNEESKKQNTPISNQSSIQSGQSEFYEALKNKIIIIDKPSPLMIDTMGYSF